MLETAFWPEGESLSTGDACEVLQAAAVFKPSLTDEAKAAVVTLAVNSVKVAKLTPAQCAAAFGSVTALHHPAQFDVMLRHVATMADRAWLAEARIEHISTIVSALGRSGTRHTPALEALAERSVELLPDATSLAHVANIAYGFACLKLPAQSAAWIELAAACERLVHRAVPLVAATLLTAFARGFRADVRTADALSVAEPLPDAVLKAVEALERSVSNRVSEMGPPLLASSAVALARCGRPAFMGTARDDIIRTVKGFGPTHVADVFEAARINGAPADQDVLGTLAERATAEVKRYRVRDLAAVLSTLVAFDLFDEALSAAAVQQVVATLRSRAEVDVHDLVTLLAAFASTGTRHNALVSAVHRQASDVPEAIAPDVLAELLKTLDALGVEPAEKLRAAARAAGVAAE